MSTGWWAANIVNIAAILVVIAGWWLQPLITRRMAESKNRSTSPLPVIYDSILPYRTIQPPPTSSSPYRTDLTRRAQKQLTWTTIIVPITTLVYGFTDVHIGPQGFHLEILPAAVVAFLFTAVTTLLIGPIGAGDRRAIRAAARICNVFGYIFAGTAIFFAVSTFYALTRAFGIKYFVAELNNPGFTAFLVGILTALSAITWRVTWNSVDLLNGLRHEPPYK